MKKILKISYIALLFLTITSCSSDDDSTVISDRALSGQVFGTSFTAKGGKSFTSGDNVSIYITNVEADCSSSIYDYTLKVSTDVPAKVGVYNNVNVVFGKEGETPLNVFGSNVEITNITENEITVKINSESGNSNVEGVFTIPFCE